jgi:hypothetical protein
LDWTPKLVLGGVTQVPEAKICAICDDYYWVGSICGKATVLDIVLKVGLFDDCVIDKIKEQLDHPTPTPLGGELRWCICSALIVPGVGYNRRRFRGRFYKTCWTDECRNKLEDEIRLVKGTGEELQLNSSLF